MSNQQALVRDGAAWAVHLACTHRCDTGVPVWDEHNLTLAIELMKAVRDDPDYLLTLFRRWDLDRDQPLREMAEVEARGLARVTP